MPSSPITSALTTKIMAVVAEMGDPAVQDIVRKVRGDEDTIRQAVKQMVCEGSLRMKDDDIGHGWAYKMTRKGRADYDCRAAHAG